MRDKPTFGIDAPGLVLGFGVGGAMALLVGLWAITRHIDSLSSTALSVGLWCSLSCVLMSITSVLTKPIVIRRMIIGLNLRGDEHVLDVGCGRGMVLLAAAEHLPRGRATGLDLWSNRDQSGNSAEVTARNAALTGLTQRVQIDTGDMRHMPYADQTFDIVVSSLAIHNLPTQTDREQAVREIARVLKPGGRVALLDFRNTKDYTRTLRANGLDRAARSAPTFLMFPWVWIVRGTKSR